MWQLAQAPATTTCEWFHLVGVHCEGLTLWQLKQLVVPCGMWVVGLVLPAVLPLWQVRQLVAAVKLLWSVLAPAQVVVLLWQLSQLPVTAAWVALLGLPTAIRKAPLWHVAQPVATE